MSDLSRELNAASDALLRDLDLLAGLELQKRELGPADARSHELATRIEELAARVLEITAHQRAITAEASERRAASLPRVPSAILPEWREAERRAMAAPEGSPEAQEARRQADELREEYRASFDARLR